jgi:hypothetical protein
MSTELQKRLAENIVKNAKRSKPLNKTELLVTTGYSEVSAKAYATTIIEQKGVQEELKLLGFEPNRAKKVIAEIMTNKHAEDKDRLKAADMILNVFGEYAPEKSITMSVKAEDLQKTITDDLNKFRAK